MSSPACPICPTASIHRVHERVDHFEALRSLRRHDRVTFWTTAILRASRRDRPARRMSAEDAERIAWQIQNRVEDELRDS